VSWSLGPILVAGALVALTGVLADGVGYANAWMIAFFVLAAMLGALAVHHGLVLPPGTQAAERPESVRAVARGVGRAFSSFFAKKGIVAMLAFAFFYRFALGLMEKIEPLFLLDSRVHGGLGLTNLAVGNLLGGLGSLAFMAGSLLGGLFVARRGLKSVLLLLCIALNLPVFGALFLSWAQPTDLTVIGGVLFLERLGWGFGAVGHMLYMMQQIAPGPYQTAHYAFGTGLMGLCLMLTGMVSGVLQQALGYPAYFVVVLVAAIPSVVATLTAPFHIEPSLGPAAPGEEATSLRGAAD
jgi:MFS transporter, PAT family, beta-lactamase induction signal transducer AmpG